MAPRPLGFWLKLVDQLIDAQFDEMLETHGVTRRQWQVLNLLSRADSTEAVLASELAPFVQDRQSEPLAEELAELVDSGWVSRSGESYALSERGRTSLSRLSGVVSGMRNTVARDISADEYAQTLSVLERMARNLGWNDPEA